ncbi:hypothetical protein [Ornithinimicrobium kibberense]|uniref:hypothetical protein n=1 Tax=Ornithinimicrobium kibberense TaxID=282060 RepID=UPI00361F36ED
MTHQVDRTEVGHQRLDLLVVGLGGPGEQDTGPSLVERPRGGPGAHAALTPTASRRWSACRTCG